MTHEPLRVSDNTRPGALAGAVSNILREQETVEVRAIGAGAVNQAIKALAIARGYLVQDGYDLSVVPSFTAVDIDGQERTAICLVVHRHRLPFMYSVSS